MLLAPLELLTETLKNERCPAFPLTLRGFSSSAVTRRYPHRLGMRLRRCRLESLFVRALLLKALTLGAEGDDSSTE